MYEYWIGRNEANDALIFLVETHGRPASRALPQLSESIRYFDANHFARIRATTSTTTVIIVAGEPDIAICPNRSSTYSYRK